MPTKSAAPAEEIYQIKITLLSIVPEIWRRVLVPATTSITELHDIIQTVMGWHDCHLHAFKICGGEYGISYEEGVSFADNPEQVLLKGFSFQAGDRFYYEYDFGDRWVHELEIEAIGTPAPRKRYPVCIDGRRTCPPENCGGCSGYRNMLHILRCRRHPEKDRLREWLGGPYDPAAFRRSEVNRRLIRSAIVR